MDAMTVAGYVIVAIACIAFPVGIAIMMLAVFDSAEKLGDELHDYFNGKEEDDA